MGYETPEIDDTVPSYDPNAGKGARWDRPMRSGTHEADLIASEIVFRQDKGEHRIKLSFLVAGSDPQECPEGPVKADLEIQLPPATDFKYRNFLDAFFPGQKKCNDVQVASLLGSKVKILTRFSPAKGAFKAKNWVDKVVEVVKRGNAPAPAPAEDDPFDDAASA